MKTKLAVLFSGGRTSGYMSKWLIDNKTNEFDMTFVFCNTGQEHENTLKFVDQCDKAFGLNLNWIEAEVKGKGVGTSYRKVTYETASRTGKPFEDVVKKFGLPNIDFPHCTRELKIEPFKKFAKDFMGIDYKIALGIRYDEPNRVRDTPENYYPLATDKQMSKGDILLWWRDQDFDLELPEHLGNCTWCWKKSEKKLLTLAKENPEIFKFPRMLEQKYSTTSNFDRKDKRVMFRGYMTTEQLFAKAKDPFVEFKENNKIQPSLMLECAEECGSVWNQKEIS